MITASDQEERVRALEAGADDFIQKPFDQAELLARVMPDSVVLERTIDVHVKVLRHKLGRLGARIRTIRRVGYCYSTADAAGTCRLFPA